MANPRQRHKARSKSHRPVSHSRNAKRNLKKTPPIRGPASGVLTALWDKRRTLRQNYAALGLAHTLNPLPSGGVEPIERTANLIEASSSQDDAAPIPKGHGRIVRDAEGNVLRVELPEEDIEQRESEKTMEELAPQLDPGIRQKWITGAGDRNSGAVEALEKKANERNGAGPRKPSQLEMAYLKRLVDKHGMDVEKMARDRKANPEQRSRGELTRGLRRCGFGVDVAPTPI